MILAPSLLSSDFGRLAEELLALEQAGLEWVHWDVMDGHFVPNITFGPPVIKALRKRSRLFFDVHLMIAEPERYLEAFAEAGADLLVVHAEASSHLPRTLSEIRRLGMKRGVALNPATPLHALEYVLPELDLVLLMSVNPGFGGQKFMPLTYRKLADLRGLISRSDSQALVQVDGGVDPGNTAALVKAGADVLVSGSAFFNFPPYAERLGVFAKAAAGA
ncbi:MAG: ribulose-phosphate 3-epimerase [Deltaproteobacteria bacterium]|jgi:ribulose-phosphate 3-epimerase|nr:ribulose-phosphate 3-epimerase [Deltaproteobacteria bacterium]